MAYSNTTPMKASVRRPAPEHVFQIAIMWMLYLFSPVLTQLHFESGMGIVLPVALLSSFASFGIAVWLLFQRSPADMAHGVFKLMLDAVVTVALMIVLLRSGFLEHMLRGIGY